jgi:hypothetical protein
MNVDEFREKIIDPILIDLYEFWLSRRQADILPARRDIDPIDIPRNVLPHIVLAEFEQGNGRIFYRLVGTKMVQEWGEDFTGKYVDEIMQGTYRTFIEGLFKDVAAHRCAVYSESTFRWDVRGTVGTRRLFMPLANDGHVVNMVLIGQTFTWTEVSRDSPTKLRENLPGHTEIVRVRELR